MQKFIYATDMMFFDKQLDRLLKEGWRVVPTTLVCERQHSYFCVVLEKVEVTPE